MALQAPDWLNAEFVQKVLRSSKKDESIEVKNVATKAATAKGDNYMSDMIRATVEYSRSESGRNVTEKMSLIVKLAPSSESHKELVTREASHSDYNHNTVTHKRTLKTLTPRAGISLFSCPHRFTEGREGRTLQYRN